MTDKPIGPASRAARFLLITPCAATAVLWAVRSIEARPWIVLHFLLLDARGLFTGHEFYFDGHWIVPGWRWLSPSYAYISESWHASLTVGLALFAGGLAAHWIDRLVIRWHRTPTLSS